MIRIRESFGAKLLSVLLGTVGLLLIVTFAVVRSVTARQVEAVAERTTQIAGTLFEERNEFRQEVVAQLSGAFTRERRALAALDAAVRDGDAENLAGQVEYEMALRDLGHALLVFTDPEGVPVLSVVDGHFTREGDPVNVAPMAEAVLFGDSLEIRGYRVVDGTIYDLRSQYLEFAFRPVGTVTFGLPIAQEDVQAIGDVGGFEACLYYDGVCVVQTAGVDDALRDAMAASIGSDEPLRIQSGGSAWSIRSEPLVSGDPAQGQRAVAVPLDAVLAPFGSIQRALFFGGSGALLLSVLFGTALSRNLTRPVKELVAATGRVAEGDYETAVTVTSHDEMRTLADAFNDMTRGLLMRERYRSVLSKVVSPDIAAELMKGDVELGGENRDMTVLFADIRGFTPLTEGMEPQDVIGLINDCMEHLASAVDAEGGVVDKFMGDEIMAVFGAPVTQPDHALRAVFAAVRMRDGIADMNRRRAERGEDPLAIGIGIATGVAVAGNMGSSDRMNYTVLGATVNLASRLTGVAQPGEILVNQVTRRAIGDACDATSLGDRSLKGFSSDVEVYSVQSIREGTEEDPGTDARAGSAPAAMIAGVGMLLGALASAAAPAPVAAQWPTLADAGVGILSENGTFQMDLSGQLDIETFYFFNEEPGLSGLAYGSEALFAPRVRLFLDTFLGDHLYGLVEWRGDRGEAPTADFWEARVEQAFLRVSNRSQSLSVQGGIFANPFGSYAARHMTVIDPFLRPPLPYDYRTVISRRWSPIDADWFSRWKTNPEEWRRDGAPPVWAVPYQWGGLATLDVGLLSFRVAGMNSPPSSEPLDWYELEVVDKISWIAGVEAKLGPSLSIGGSFNDGPYVASDIPNASTVGSALGDATYDQRIWSADIAYARGPAMLRAELIHDTWDIPNVDDRAVELGYSVEAQVDVATGWSTALRWGRIDFRDIAGMGDWDWDVDRLEGAVSYRITRNAGIMLTYGSTWDSGPLDPDDDLAGVRLWWGF